MAVPATRYDALIAELRAAVPEARGSAGFRLLPGQGSTPCLRDHRRGRPGAEGRRPLGGRDLRAHRVGGGRRRPRAAGRRPAGSPVRLDCVDSGHDPAEARVLELIRTQRGAEPPGVLKTLHYRPELFGRPYSDCPRRRHARPLRLDYRRARALRRLRLLAQPVPVLNGFSRRGRVVCARRRGLGRGSAGLANGAGRRPPARDARVSREAHPAAAMS